MDFNSNYHNTCLHIYKKPNTDKVLFPFKIDYTKNKDNFIAFMTD